jgi:putative membrane protein
VKWSLRLALMLAGLIFFGWFAARAGLEGIFAALGRLGWLAPLAFLPYALVYLVDTTAWSFGFRVRPAVTFGQLFRVRWSGEAVNNVVPTAYVGGEAVKIYLLRKRGVTTGEGAAAAVVSRSTQTLAQLIFIALAALAFARLSPGDGPLHRGMLTVVAISTVLVTGMFWVQRRGFFYLLRATLDRLRLRVKSLDRHRERLLGLDRQIQGFYRDHKLRFLLSTGAYLAGWLLDPLEIYVVGRLMDVELTWLHALAIEAFISVAKIMGMFVPGAVGVQESGVVLLCRLAGLPDFFGLAYAILRRGREALYALVGWTLLYSEEASFTRLREKVTTLTNKD